MAAVDGPLPSSDRYLMRRITIALLALCCGCTAAPQPEPAVAAVDVPLPTQLDRDDFLAVLRRSAAAHGFHADAASPSEIKRSNSISPITVNVTVWRGVNDDEVVASGMDGAEHVGRVWLSFEKGSAPQQFSHFRVELMRQIQRRWPATLPLPIMPNGAIPLPRDLIRTKDGYRVSPAAASKYRS